MMMGEQEEMKDDVEEEKKGEDVDMDEPDIDVFVNCKQILKTALLKKPMTVTMVTKGGEYECVVEVEAAEEPKTEILIKAKL